MSETNDPKFNPNNPDAERPGDGEGYSWSGKSDDPVFEKPERTVGMKFDGDKTRMDLLHPAHLVGIAQVLTFGARKYAAGNWRKVKHAHDRYLGALLRHLFAWVLGEAYDAETGLHHLDHAATCLMFLRGLEAEEVPVDESPCDDQTCAHCFPGASAPEGVISKADLDDDIREILNLYKSRGVDVRFSESDFVTDLHAKLKARGCYGKREG